jgi:hypothetical protein
VIRLLRGHRCAVEHARETYEVSERWACRSGAKSLVFNCQIHGLDACRNQLFPSQSALAGRR